MSEIYVNSKQLLKAAKLLAEAEPAVALGIAEERPGFLSQEQGTNYLTLTIGILGTTTHCINRTGDEVIV